MDEDIGSTESRLCKFGISSTQSLGLPDINFTICNVVLKFPMNILEIYLPISFSLADIDHLQMYYKKLEDNAFYVPSAHIAKISRKFYHLFTQWNQIYHCLFSET